MVASGAVLRCIGVLAVLHRSHSIYTLIPIAAIAAMWIFVIRRKR